MNDELLKYMNTHGIVDGILREFLFNGKMEAAKQQVYLTWERHNKILTAIEELSIFIEKECGEE